MPESAQSTPGKLLLVLGMHRSGTSLLSGLLAGAGMDLGNNLMAPAEDNPKGFWESQRITTLHEEFLNLLGHSWSSFAPLPEDWLDTPQATALRNQLSKCLDEDFSQRDRICVKDPRLCRVLPLWRRVAADTGLDLYCVSIVRPAEEVIASLRQRDGIGYAHGRALWLRYNLDWEAHSRGLPLVRTSYEQVLRDSTATLNEIRSMLDIDLANPDAEFADARLKHHRAASNSSGFCDSLYHTLSQRGETPARLFEEEISPLAQEAADLERRLAEAAAGELTGDSLTSAREHLLFDQAQEARQFATSLKKELDTGRAYISAMETELETRKDYVQSFEKEIAARDADIEVKAQYIDSLQEELEKREQYALSLSDHLKNERTAHAEDIARREEYAQSLLEELNQLRHRFRHLISIGRFLKGR
jgi:hypothetical protein